MAIYLDTPMWPAHGTLFAHLISDESLVELHAFAAAAGIRRRAFDEDHYDVPAHRCGDLVARGAHRVDCGTLARVLTASGLRVPARQRSSSLTTPLLVRWREYMPNTEYLGAELIRRWGEPHRRYHHRVHLLAVLEALDALSGPVGPPPVVVLAAWFHDAVYDGVAGRDEERSAQLAEARLPRAGLGQADIAEVARLIRLTAHHQPRQEDDCGAMLCDADLSVLAGGAAAYARYVDGVRAEYPHLHNGAFATGRAGVVRALLARQPIFSTAEGRRLWEELALANLTAERQRLGAA